ncbi:hypothetical protein HKCCSP123_16195 [Rhodobacterales bacterium HKCCSP123]|nr:hypothetical protein [Rhodobacterales bacterium HKCCSP123]
MNRIGLLSSAALCFLAASAIADPSPAEFEDARTACRDAFLARDVDAYLNAASTMIGWGEVESSGFAREIELCLAFADFLDGVNLEEVRSRAAALTQLGIATSDPGGPPTADGQLEEYLARAQGDDSDMAALAAEIAADEDFAPSASAARDALETALNEYVTPIPAARAEQNLTAYRALARVNPEEARYQERIQRYEAAILAAREQLERTARQLEGRLIRTVAEFDGSSWARHPSSPRFQDIRDYVTLYLIETASGRQSLELFINYTSRDGWLFVQGASLNVDGETSRLPVPRWFRDNDTEIWEFGSITGPDAISIAQRIAEADRAVIRFNGQQFYDDYVVSDTDKRVMREMLAMWNVISAD